MVDSGAEGGFRRAASETERSAVSVTIHPVLFGAAFDFPGAAGGELTKGTGRKGRIRQAADGHFSRKPDSRGTSCSNAIRRRRGA